MVLFYKMYICSGHLNAVVLIKKKQTENQIILYGTSYFRYSHMKYLNRNVSDAL